MGIESRFGDRLLCISIITLCDRILDKDAAGKEMSRQTAATVRRGEAGINITQVQTLQHLRA